MTEPIAVLQGHTAPVEALAILPNGHIVSGSDDNSLRIWDPATGECIAVLTEHTASVNTLAIFPNGDIVSGSGDCSIRIWDGSPYIDDDDDEMNACKSGIY